MSGITRSFGTAARRAGMADAAWAALRAVIGWPGRVYRSRQVMHALGRLDDHELCDIGLTRLDLRAASALQVDVDPSHMLRVRAEERRRRT